MLLELIAMCKFFKCLLQGFSPVFLLVGPAHAMGTDSLISGYERNIDQRIVESTAAGPDASEAFIVTKKYLENRKAAVDRERAKYIAYEVRRVKDGKTIPLQTYRREDAPEITSIARFGDSYVIPVIRADRHLELYKYVPGGETLQRVNTPERQVRGKRIERVFVLENGYVEVTSVGAELAVGFRSYDGAESLSLDLGDAAGRIVAIDDVMVIDGTIYVLLASQEQSSESLSVWLYRFDSHFAASSRFEDRLVRENAVSIKSRFVDSTHKFPSAEIAIRKSLGQPPIVKLMALGETLKLVKPLDAERVEGEPNFAVAGICDDEYIVAKKLFSKNSISKKIEYQTIGSDGKVKRTWNVQMVDHGSIVDISLVPLTRDILSLVNFSRFEDARRKNGWYSWLGYRVDRFNVLQNCD